MSKKTWLRDIKPYVELHRDPNTGIAWVEDGTTGNGHSAHPSIDGTGSVTGMKKQGYWAQDATTVRSHGFIYNISSLVITDEYDQIAANNCRCASCCLAPRREADSQTVNPLEAYKAALIEQGFDPIKVDLAFAQATHLLKIMEKS